MTAEFIEAERPRSYHILRQSLLCRDCGNRFECLVSADNLLVKFIDQETGVIRWLPTYERGGYLDLISQLVPGFGRNDEITMQVFKRFEESFRQIQEPATGGNTYTVENMILCPKCSSSSTVIMDEEVLDTPEVCWMRYQPRVDPNMGLESSKGPGLVDAAVRSRSQLR